ncbi:MAG: KTSC domain-containing protein [Terricaulis sp.]
MPSSVIASYEYDAAKSVLTITFTTGRIYAYEDVPHAAYEAFRFARSKGRYFNEHIRDLYRPTELTEKPPRHEAQVLPFKRRDEL